ncbi:hypothetical protein ACFLXU_01350 [Chloroflexota bacterium]
MKYYPYGGCRNSQGTLGTDKKFTGQRLDGTGLYYYNARYYDDYYYDDWYWDDYYYDDWYWEDDWY